jgi:DNA-binding MarR family transcriptional regulator
MDYTLLKSLIAQLEAFQQAQGSNQLSDFVIWLNQQLFSPSQHGEQTTHDELLISFKLLYLNKELKKQTKSVLSPSKVSSIDEYSFLLHLDYQDSFRKMEIIELHNLEPPTGIEIIKRLLKNGLIESFPDEQDKRAKRIRITDKGVMELKALQPQIEAVFTSFTAPLSLDEKIHMSGILDKLSSPPTD